MTALICAVSDSVPILKPLMLMPCLPPEVDCWKCVISPFTSSCAGVIWPMAGFLLPPATLPDAPKSCSPIASMRMSFSPSTMKRPVLCRLSVRTVPNVCASAVWPSGAVDLFSNFETVIE